MWPNPLAVEAVIEPLLARGEVGHVDPEPGRRVVHVEPDTVAGVHDRSLFTSGFTALKFGLVKVPVNNGLAGAWETPFLVM